MAKHNKQEISNNEEEGLTIEEFSKEAIKLIKELKAEKIHSNTLEEQVQGLKIEVEEHKCIEESLQKKLEEINREREALEAEVVSLRKEVKKGKLSKTRPTYQGCWKNSSTINDLTTIELASVTKKKK